jgi:hypothetical protein
VDEILYYLRDSHFLHRAIIVLGWSQIKTRQTKTFADSVAGVSVEEKSHAFGTQVAFSVFLARCSVNLRVGVQVADTLDVHDDEFMTRSAQQAELK